MVRSGMSLLTDIRVTFPNWPDDVIEQWLIPQAVIDGAGWPPPTPMTNTRWEQIFLGRPIVWWQNVHWALQPRNLSGVRLSQVDQLNVNQLQNAHVRGYENLHSSVVDGRKRFQACLEFIIERKMLPKPVIAIETEAGLRLADGSHRVAALMTYLESVPESIENNAAVQAAWIGLHAGSADS